MTMKPDTATLRALLPQIEAAGDGLEDETLGQLICALSGDTFVGVRKSEILCSDPFAFILRRHRQGAVGEEIMFMGRDRPDTDLTSADALVREVLPEWYAVYAQSAIEQSAKLWKPNGPSAIGFHDTNLCLAILAATIRAVLAQEDKDCGFTSAPFP